MYENLSYRSIARKIISDLKVNYVFTVIGLLSDHCINTKAAKGKLYNENSFKNALHNVVAAERRLGTIIPTIQGGEKIYKIVKRILFKKSIHMKQETATNPNSVINFRNFARYIFSDLPKDSEFTRDSLQEKYNTQAVRVFGFNHNKTQIIDAIGHIMKHEALLKFGAVSFNNIGNRKKVYIKTKNVQLLRDTKALETIQTLINSNPVENNNMSTKYTTNKEFSVTEIGYILGKRFFDLINENIKLNQIIKDKSKKIETLEKENTELYDELDQKLVHDDKQKITLKDLI